MVFRLVQAYLAATMAYGLTLGRTGVIVYSGRGLAATIVPALVARRWRTRLPWPLLLWIVVPVFLHSFGIANGLYRADFWWDQVTHVTSSTLVAAIGYTTVRTIDVHHEDVSLADGISLPDRLRLAE